MRRGANMPIQWTNPAEGAGSFNGKGRIRTADTRIFSAVLYQLSYLAGRPT
jgi:hypothetical protein